MNRIDHSKLSFAKTNIETINQRVFIINEYFSNIQSIGEICCGDCLRQFTAYKNELDLGDYLGLDIDETIVAFNKTQNIKCIKGDALDKKVMSKFLDKDLLFFGPPLSSNCDGHAILNFDQVQPDFFSFLKLLYVELNYNGIINCICPKKTTMGDITKLYNSVKEIFPGITLPIINYSYSSTTGSGVKHDSRLKYVELWFSNSYADNWKIVELGKQHRF